MCARARACVCVCGVYTHTELFYFKLCTYILVSIFERTKKIQRI